MSFRYSSISLALLLVFGLYAQSAAGMAVSDATSYVYYVQQLEKLQKQLDIQDDTLSTVNDVYDTAQDLYDSFNGTYDDLDDIVGGLNSLKKVYEKHGSSFQEYLDKYYPDADDQEKYMDDNGFIDTEVLLDDEIGDPVSSDTDVFDEAAKMNSIKRLTQLGALDNAEAVIGGMADDNEKLQTLVGKISSAKTPQEKMDLGNHFSAEILSNIQQLKVLVARILEIMAAERYDGSGKNVANEEDAEEHAKTGPGSISFIEEYADKDLDYGELPNNL